MKISDAGFANISQIKMTYLERHVTAYTVPVAVLTFKAIQGK